MKECAICGEPIMMEDDMFVLNRIRGSSRRKGSPKQYLCDDHGMGILFEVAKQKVNHRGGDVQEVFKQIGGD